MRKLSNYSEKKINTLLMLELSLKHIYIECMWLDQYLAFGLVNKFAFN